MFQLGVYPFEEPRSGASRIEWVRAILFLSLAAFLFLEIPAGQSQNCTFYDWDIEKFYIDVPANTFVEGVHPIYTDPDCQTEFGHESITDTAIANSAEEAMAICEANMGEPVASVRLATDGTNTYYCEVGQRKGSSQERREELFTMSQVPDEQSALARCMSHDPKANRVEPTGTIANHWVCLYVWRVGGSGSSGSGSRLPVRPERTLDGLQLDAADGMNSGIQFKRLDNYGVGDPKVFEMGFLDAVDIWSHIGGGYEVCFPQAGRIVFLDAATSPRTLLHIDYFHRDGFTCATMDRAGTMALVKAPAQTESQSSMPTQRRYNDPVSSAIALEACSVTPRFNLRLRAAPWDRILDTVPAGEGVAAKARTQSWFRVSYGGQEGWLAAWLANSADGCGWTSDE